MVSNVQKKAPSSSPSVIQAIGNKVSQLVNKDVLNIGGLTAVGAVAYEFFRQPFSNHFAVGPTSAGIALGSLAYRAYKNEPGDKFLGFIPVNKIHDFAANPVGAAVLSAAAAGLGLFLHPFVSVPLAGAFVATAAASALVDSASRS